MMHKIHARGFTLIELMIVVAIIGIIAAIAYPSYQGSVSKTRRADAQRALTEHTQRMETYYTENKSYAGAPAPADTDYYTLSISASSATTYTLLADPMGAQEGNGNLEIDNTGAKGWDKNDDGDTDDTGENSWHK